MVIWFGWLGNVRRTSAARDDIGYNDLDLRHAKKFNFMPPALCYPG